MGKLIRGAELIIAATLLTGCLELPVQVSRDGADDAEPNAKTVSVSGQDVTLGDAAGYCINDRQSRYTAAGAFVVMAPCSDSDEAMPTRGLVLINVLASQPLQDALKTDKMDAFFRSDEGRMALSAKGKASDVEILGTMGSKGSYVVHSRDAAGPVIPDTSDEQWRLFMVVADRLVSISMVNFTDAPMPDGEIFTQLEGIARAIRALNG